MSVRRLALTTLAMASIGLVLVVLTPALPAMTNALAHPQRTADVSGPDALVLAAGGLLAWGVWAWGAAGLALTALSAVPGVAGAAARLLLRVVLPAGARRGAALVLGLSLGVTAPLLGAASLLLPTPAAAAVQPAGLPDWPTAAPAPVGPAVPDWPSAPAADPLGSRAPGARVVLRGDCLWDIAATWLRDRSGRAPTDSEVADAVHAWWSANAEVIGPDPDLLLPGQVLDPPSLP
ncbi:MAG: LysM peptidoglycan-binding domain-containing protein [Blastococcus sp.]